VLLFLVNFGIAAGVSGCICGHFFVGLAVHGQLLLEESGAPLEAAILDAAVFTAGNRTVDTQAVRLVDAQGAFELNPANLGGTCTNLFGGSTGQPVLPRPDAFEVVVTRESFPQELDIQPDLRSGDDVRIVCPCRQTFTIPITAETAEFLDPPQDDPNVQFVVELKDPILVPTNCESCCTLLVLRGMLANLLDESPRLAVSRLNANGLTQQSWFARRQWIDPNGFFEGWFAEPAGTCPPGDLFAAPNGLELDVGVSSADGEWSCSTRILLEALTPVVSVIDAGGPFPRTVVELQESVVVLPCPPP
jgi:hypothetical protein